MKLMKGEWQTRRKIEAEGVAFYKGFCRKGKKERAEGHGRRGREGSDAVRNNVITRENPRLVHSKD